MELDALSQVEGVDEAPLFGLGDLGSQRRDHVGALRREVEQAVEDLARNLGRFGVRDVSGVERDGLGSLTEGKGVATAAPLSALDLCTPATTGNAVAERRPSGRPRST